LPVAGFGSGAYSAKLFAGTRQGGKAVRRDVEVVHFALEIDAKPPKR
jgi:hypothetical protein